VVTLSAGKSPQPMSTRRHGCLRACYDPDR
jgi:hypothetical protein